MTYLIGTYPEARLVKCCDVEHPLSGHCGDTSFGLQNGWHGKLDILIMDKDESGQPALGLPVFIVESFDDDDDVSVSSANSYDNHKDNSWAQSIAETIVFSFLQRKQNFGNLQNYLIPGIGISSEKIVVFMYDCENDVLLASVGMDLFDKGDVHMRTIIFLWLVLNYKLFCSGVIDDFKSYRANFHRLVGDEKLEQYKTEVSFPFCINYTKNKRFDPNKLYTPKNLKRSLDYPEVKSLKLFKKQ
ncbi:uncharacterized protein LOC132719526 [Ruditapes philippinarum]|uniref:uncharacterized protein LOC132719526 n=1 Tax=Ruditapes philippinarum TaxID=129788 RepID=UPI00295BC17F|nr:uncharacterized protein LOC132719526 [Ruditapes philippinarum]